MTLCWFVRGRHTAAPAEGPNAFYMDRFCFESELLAAVGGVRAIEMFQREQAKAVARCKAACGGAFDYWGTTEAIADGPRRGGEGRQGGSSDKAAGG